MPFQPSQALIICEVNIIKLLNHLKCHEKNLDCTIPPPLAFLPVENDLLDESEPLCRFYRLMINLINKSLFIKQNLSNKLPLDISKQNKELNEIKIQLVEQIDYLMKEQPGLWAYLLQRQAGRQSIYYLLYTNIVNRRPWGSYNVFIDWARELQATATCPVEAQIIRFISCITVDLWSEQEGIKVLYISDEYLNNPFISTNLALRTSLQTSGELFEKIMIFDLLKSPLPHSDKVPFFMSHFIGILFSYHVLNKLFSLKLNAEEFIEIFSNTHLPSFFPQSCQLSSKEPDVILHIIYLTYHYMRVHTRVFALSIDQELIFKKWHHHLLLMLLKTYNKLCHIISVTPESLFMLAECSSELIQTKAHTFWHVAFDSEQEFWETVGIIYNHKGYVKIEFVELLNKNVNIIIDYLVRYDNPDEATYILGSYLELGASKTLIEQQNHKNYCGLFHILKFYCLIPKIKEEQADSLDVLFEINSLLAYFWNDIIELQFVLDDLTTIFLKKSFNYLILTLKANLQKYLKNLSPYIKPHELSEHQQTALYKTQGLVAQIFKLLGASSHEESQILEYLKQQALCDIRLTQLLLEKPTPVKLKQKSKTSDITPPPELIISPSSLTQVNSQAHLLNPNVLPQALIALSKKIKECWKTNLILTGGAVTSLFLRRPNPYDYDCLLFDNNLSDLPEKFAALGYPNSKIVGKEFPILKLVIQQEPENIKIDIAVFSFNSNLNLDENMAKILSLRDFKLSALYIDLGNIDKLEIKGFDHAIRSVNLKLISIVENKNHIFTEDPLRLLRLVKIQLQYPDFRNDGLLNQILKHTCIKTCLKTFLAKELNQARFGTALENLFKRFDAIQVIEKMAKLGLIDVICDSPFTKLQPFLPIFQRYSQQKLDDNIQADKVKRSTPRPDSPIALDENDYLDNIKGYSIKLAFFHFLTAHFCLYHGQLQFADWCFSGVLRRIKPIDNLATTYIQETLWKLPASCLLIDQTLTYMLNQVQQTYQAQTPERKL